jgi:hypothetical protein
MKSLKWLTGCMGLVFILCATSLAAINVQSYLNAIEAAIAGGTDPIQLAVDLASANPALADEFAVAIATAAPDIDLIELATRVCTAVPNQAEAVCTALMAAFPTSAGAISVAVANIPGVPAGQITNIQQAANQYPSVNAFQATNNNTNNNQNLQNQNTESQQYQQQQRDQGVSPSN